LVSALEQIPQKWQPLLRRGFAQLFELGAFPVRAAIPSHGQEML
jgi:hypothetical protein